MNSRRHFLKLSGTGILAAGATSLYGSSISSLPPQRATVTDTFSVGMAGYTFKNFNVEKTIEMLKKVGIK
jgi:hypothetical protein